MAASKKTGKPSKPFGKPKGAVLLMVAMPRPPKGGKGGGPKREAC